MAYTQVKVSVSPELATSFKAACAAANVSMTSVLTGFMADYSQLKTSTGPSSGVSTRRMRRAMLKRLIGQLETISTQETYYRDKIPENLQGSSVYDRADESVSSLEEALDLLASVY